YRIQTDKGEIVIQTEDDDVEVVVKGENLVTIYDPKSGQKLVLRSGTYELELKGKPTGLKLDLDKVTLKRGDKPIVKIERVKKDDPPEVAKVGEVRRFQWESAVQIFGVSPDGSLVLANELLPGAAHELVLWDLAKGEVVHRLKGHRSRIWAASFSPDGKKIVSCSQWPPEDSIHIWDVKSGKVLNCFQPGGGHVYDAKFSADSQQIFFCGNYDKDRSVRMWDAETGKEVKRFMGHRGIVSRLAVSPDGRYLVTFGRGEPDFSARVWDVKTGEGVQQLKGITGQVNYAAFLPDSRRIFVQQEGDHLAPR